MVKLALTQPEPIYGWLKTYGEISTQRVFLASVKQYLAFIYQQEVNNSNLEKLGAQYIDECKGGSRDWFKDLLSFAASFHGKPPKTAHTYVSAAKNWIEFCLDIEISRKQLRLLRGRLPKGTRAWTEEVEINRDVLRRIFTHLPLHGKALYLLLASSGIRIGEALQLKLNDVDLSTDPPKVTVRGEYTKAGDTYYTFMSKEAKEALVEWLKQRDAYLKSSAKRGVGLSKTGYGRGRKSTETDRLFPFSNVVAEHLWWNALQKTGLADKDGSTNRRKIHVHMLRKFFQTQMKYAGVSEDVVEALIGHSAGLDEAYRRYTREQIAEAYKKGEVFLLINVPRDISEIQSKFQKDVEELRSQVMDLTRKLTDSNAINLKVLTENRELLSDIKIKEEKIEELEAKLNQLTERINRYEDFTRRFMRATSEELEEIGREIFKRERKSLEQILKEAEVAKHEEVVKRDMEKADEIQWQERRKRAKTEDYYKTLPKTVIE